MRENKRAVVKRSPFLLKRFFLLSVDFRLVTFFRVSNRFPQFRRRVRHVDVIDSERRERIHDGVGDGWRGAVRAGFADALDAERIKRIGRYRFPGGTLAPAARAHYA